MQDLAFGGCHRHSSTRVFTIFHCTRNVNTIE
jgi:hypothetical protein